MGLLDFMYTVTDFPSFMGNERGGVLTTEQVKQRIAETRLQKDDTRLVYRQIATIR